MDGLATYRVKPRPESLTYLVALLATASATAAQFFLFDVLKDAEPYMPYVIAVMVTASYGGWKAGLLATALGALASDYFFVAPYFSLGMEEAGAWAALAQFVIAGTTISWLCETLHRVRRCLEAKRERLEQEIQERWKAEAALRASEARLQEADRHKDDFLATLAHELRNPLGAIRSAVRLLQLRGIQEQERERGREVIGRQVECLSRLIEDLLDVSRIRRGKIELRKERVDLTEAIQVALESSRPLIERYGHELTVRLPPEPIELKADMMRLNQVFMNLLDNAAKYTRPGGQIRLTVEHEGNSVRVSVKDTGIGIPTNKLAHIFEMFFQIDRSSEQSEGGLGIGLALVRRLVEMHDGTIEARSEGLGKGSEFLVRLPVAAMHHPRPESTNPAFA